MQAGLPKHSRKSLDTLLSRMLPLLLPLLLLLRCLLLHLLVGCLHHMCSRRLWHQSCQQGLVWKVLSINIVASSASLLGRKLSGLEQQGRLGLHHKDILHG